MAVQLTRNPDGMADASGGSFNAQPGTAAEATASAGIARTIHGFVSVFISAPG